MTAQPFERVDVITLTDDEVALARRWGWLAKQWGTHWGAADDALAARLQARVGA